ncbi:hypothetical protein BCR34DRAFT_571323 [Clohesyomyces aquaticus]|uniref:Uncharacterized protein n=1 Tax=Clohesyomyces aquaticus TaxID=1231657 RepID=A0A1Y1Z9Q9_9PLEO|nr:hypothetical protein BCR34DRAFT_571323 [Clohesyomyces aquaticus]
MAASREAQAILAHLLSKLQETDSKYFPRYGKWVQSHESLDEFLMRCLRPEVLRFLQLGSGTIDAMRNIGGDLKFEGRGIYVHGILGLDKRVRAYIGQSTSLSTRFKQHWNFRYRRDNPSLHYYGVQHSTFDTFSVLATLPSSTSPGFGNLPGMSRPDLVLNILEMWCCLLFRSLPMKTLDEFLPPGYIAKPSLPWPLNIANPLDHGDQQKRDWVDLSGSQDTLINEYLNQKVQKVEQKVDRQDRHPSHFRSDEIDGIVLTPGAVIVLSAAIIFGFFLIRKSMNPQIVRPPLPPPPKPKGWWG